jgi:predicted RNase H-like HicB family nuclease
MKCESASNTGQPCTAAPYWVRGAGVPAGLAPGDRVNRSAYVPDLPGCVASGGSVAEVEQRIRAAVHLHVERLRAHGEPVPQPSAAAVRLVDDVA